MHLLDLNAGELPVGIDNPLRFWGLVRQNLRWNRPIVRVTRPTGRQSLSL